MAPELTIQASRPRTEIARDPEDASLSDAVQAVFPRETENMFLVWNGVYVPIGYKSDFSFMIDDVLDLADAMLASPSGHTTIHWPSNTFASTWDVRWDAGLGTIDARWFDLVGGTEGLLAASGSMRVHADDFLAEWKLPLEIVARALREAGYDERQVPRLALLDDVLARLPRYGRLYQHAR
jgi:hypothetical protein